MSLGKKKIQMQGAAGITGTDHFTPFLYTGTGSSSATTFTGVGFDPDMCWVKNRDSSGENHGLGDTVRGGGYLLYPNLTLAQATSDYIRPTTDGFVITTGNNNILNHDYVAWCWKTGGSAVSNTDGSDTTSVSANQDAGFSIVSLSKTDTNTRTYGHGLSSAPEMIILKRTVSADDWYVYHKDLGNTVRISLNTSAANVTSTGVWGSTTPTDSVFTLQNQLGGAHIAYCFHSVDSYQKVGSYTGTGLTGNAVATGFSPRFVMIKDSTQGGNWIIHSKPPTTTNPSTTHLRANSSAAEDSGTGERINFDANGFTVVGTGGNVNTGNHVYIYLAIA